MSYVLKFSIQREHLESARSLPKVRPVVVRVDVNEEKLLVRVISSEPLTEEVVRRWIENAACPEAKNSSLPACCLNAQRPSVSRLIGLIVLVLLIGVFLSKFGLFTASVALGSTVSVGAAFLLGLFAASSSCIAVSGGVLLSTVGAVRNMRTVWFFVIGRIMAYVVFGGLIGYIGSALLLSSSFLGFITIVAAVYMIVMGLDLLNLAPKKLKAVLPKIPASLSAHRAGSPFFLGATTFFLPCGFTQALQLYALTTGSALISGLLLGAFAIGTAPSLLALGFASSSLKGKAGRFFLQLSGVAVIILGLWNIQNGMTIAGYPLTLPKIEVSQASETESETASDLNVEIADGEQVIRMTLTARDPYYYPSDSFTVTAGMPVRLEIEGEGTGCRSIFQIPKLNVREELDKQVNVIAFTPKKAGTYTFSCSMGMFKGSLKVVES